MKYTAVLPAFAALSKFDALGDPTAMKLPLSESDIEYPASPPDVQPCMVGP
eukprot:CAMPEP_0172569606 /NCGR_PEP_ID=MMETSP1067-20121228/124218_1 /TAXON_ID=265564 ORGANISM="Thalassiosira punctigera, Strain Tpunct2005C2" /NCGR_SAMPLE_ID=MMETSP1067 /ASSEMBLY_ACC=CAM_ASM_000444 /LENGTH=50 /DNA_ID=CAMNT_0013361475 /DNA_START=267 /DNA_END=419 /DNA_ORIENTATION=+